MLGPVSEELLLKYGSNEDWWDSTGQWQSLTFWVTVCVTGAVTCFVVVEFLVTVTVAVEILVEVEQGVDDWAIGICAIEPWSNDNPREKRPPEELGDGVVETAAADEKPEEGAEEELELDEEEAAIGIMGLVDVVAESVESVAEVEDGIATEVTGVVDESAIIVEEASVVGVNVAALVVLEKLPTLVEEASVLDCNVVAVAVTQGLVIIGFEVMAGGTLVEFVTLVVSTEDVLIGLEEVR